MDNHSISILITSDSPLVHAGLRTTLLQGGFEKLFDADSVALGMQMANAQPFQVIVFHTIETNEIGLKAIQELREGQPHLCLIVVSHYPNRKLVKKLLEHGVQGCLCLRATQEDLLEAVKRVTNGEHFVSVGFENSSDAVKSPQVVGKDLSERELQVLALIGDGKTTKAIASHLGLALSSVETYRERLKAKLNFVNSSELTRFAILWRNEHDEG